MSITLTRDAQDDPWYVEVILGEAHRRGSQTESGYYVELEGEPGQTLAEGRLVDIVGTDRFDVAIIQPMDEHAEKPVGDPVPVDISLVTQVVIP